MTFIVDVLQAGTNNHPTTSQAGNYYATDLLTDGVVGTIGNSAGVAPATGAMAVNASGTPDTNVWISSGVAYVSCTPTSQSNQRLRVQNTASFQQAIQSNSTGSTVYDYIYLAMSPANAANPDVAADNVASIVVSRSTSASVDNGVGSGGFGILLAVVTVINGFVTITNPNIADKRSVTGVSASSATVATTGWSPLSVQPSVSSGYNQGNKQFLMAMNNINLTSVLSPGMRFTAARSIAPPTQSMAFASSSSQYANKTSPSGITFTGNFTIETWIFLPGTYATGGIIGMDSTGGSGSGWELDLLSTGQLSLYWRNGSGFSQFETYASLPLGEWVHIAAVATVATPTVQFYINGVAVPVLSAGTAATSVVQATANLTLANRNSTSGYLTCDLSETRVWPSARTATQIQDNMVVNLSGTEGEVCLFPGNGNFNDITSNANNLTAQNGASATNNSNPFNATEYGIITSIWYSSPNTYMTVFTGKGYNIPNQVLNAAQYSSLHNPYGFPSQRSNWRVRHINYTDAIQNSPALSTYYNPGGLQLAVPIGSWRIFYEAVGQAIRTGTQGDMVISLASVNNAEGDAELVTWVGVAGASGGIGAVANIHREKSIDLAALTTFYLNISAEDASSTSIAIRGDLTPTNITAECGYI